MLADYALPLLLNLTYLQLESLLLVESWVTVACSQEFVSCGFVDADIVRLNSNLCDFSVLGLDCISLAALVAHQRGRVELDVPSTGEGA